MSEYEMKLQQLSEDSGVNVTEVTAENQILAWEHSWEKATQVVYSFKRSEFENFLDDTLSSVDDVDFEDETFTFRVTSPQHIVYETAINLYIKIKPADDLDWFYKFTVYYKPDLLMQIKNRSEQFDVFAKQKYYEDLKNGHAYRLIKTDSIEWLGSDFMAGSEDKFTRISIKRHIPEGWRLPSMNDFNVLKKYLETQSKNQWLSCMLLNVDENFCLDDCFDSSLDYCFCINIETPQIDMIDNNKPIRVRLVRDA